MGNIVEFVPRRTEPPEKTPVFDIETDMFLITEGLELLAAYRSITDRDVRLQVKEMVERIAKTDTR